MKPGIPGIYPHLKKKKGVQLIHLPTLLPIMKNSPPSTQADALLEKQIDNPHRAPMDGGSSPAT